MDRPGSEGEEDTDAHLENVQRLVLHAGNRVAANVESDSNRTLWQDFQTPSVVDRELITDVEQRVPVREDAAEAESSVGFHLREGRLNQKVAVVDHSLGIALDEVRTVRKRMLSAENIAVTDTQPEHSERFRIEGKTAAALDGLLERQPSFALNSAKQSNIVAERGNCRENAQEHEKTSESFHSGEIIIQRVR